MRPLIVSELRKTVSTRYWWGLLLGAALTSLLFNLAAGAISRTASSTEPANATLGYSVATSLSLCGTFAMIIGILSVTSEFRHRTIATSYLFVPNRDRLLAAKAIVAAALGGGVGLVVAVVGVPAGLLGARVAGLPDPGRLLSVCVLGIVVSAAWAPFGVAIGALVNNQLTAVIGALVYFLLVETLLAALLTTIRAPTVAYFLPGDAPGTALSALAEDRVTVFGPPGLPPWWLALLTFLAYVALAGWMALVTTRGRDIS